MAIKPRLTFKTFLLRVLLYLVLFIMAFLVLYPLFFMLMTSVKSSMDVIRNPFWLTGVHLGNYVTAWKIGRVAGYFMNSVIVSVSTLIFQVVVITLASYSLGKLRPWGHNIILSCILMMMFVTTEMTTVPNYMLLNNLHLMGSRMCLILVYVATGLSMGTYILTNFIRELPKELDDAALIDGAGVFQIMTRIDLPLVLPAMSTLVIFNFNGIWSEFYWALLTIRSDSYKTLPLGLINFQSQFTANYGVLTAGLTILTVPVVIVYLFFSKQFIANISAGALKG